MNPSMLSRNGSAISNKPAFQKPPKNFFEYLQRLAQNFTRNMKKAWNYGGNALWCVSIGKNSPS